jgi:hypothetical protein
MGILLATASKDVLLHILDDVASPAHDALISFALDLPMEIILHKTDSSISDKAVSLKEITRDPSVKQYIFDSFNLVPGDVCITLIKRD